MKITLSIIILVMTVVVTFVGIAVNNGIHSGFVVKWFKSWGLAFVVALPVYLLIMPLRNRAISSYVID